MCFYISLLSGGDDSSWSDPITINKYSQVQGTAEVSYWNSFLLAKVLHNVQILLFWATSYCLYIAPWKSPYGGTNWTTGHKIL